MTNETSYSLVNLGALAKPANTLIVKLSEAAGGFFLPYQIVRTAKAKAEATITKANAEIAVSDLQKRAQNRAIAEQVRHQENIESIASRAIPRLTANADADKIENDWVVNFLDKARNISNDEMQELWAKILAGEASEPGTFSRRTVNFIADIDKDDAELFSRLCGFRWKIGEHINALIFNYRDVIYEKNGITFSLLQHLESIGLITFNHMSGLQMNEMPRNTLAHYCGMTIELSLPSGTIEVGKVELTRVGSELSLICGDMPVDGFFEYVKGVWSNYIVAQARPL